MPDKTTIADDKKAMDLLASGNVPDDLKPKVMQKLGVDDMDVAAWSKSENVDPIVKTQVRNKIFEKVAENQPIEDPGAFTAMQGVRFLAKNFIDQDIDTQKNFFKKFGYDARSDGNTLYILDKQKNRRIAIDPNSVDAWDLSDILTDALEGIAVGGATVAGATQGAIYGSALGPLGTTAGLIGGGLIGAASAGMLGEATRQGIALSTGARKSPDFSRVGESGALSALFSPLDIIGVGTQVRGKAKALKYAGDKVEQKISSTVKEAADLLGLELLPSQIKKSKLVERLEQSLAERPWLIAGKGLRKQIESNKEKLQTYLKAFIAPKNEMGMSTSGALYAQNLIDSVSTKLAPVKAVYDSIGAKLKDAKLNELLPNEIKAINAKTEGKKISYVDYKLGDFINELKDSLEGDSIGQSYVNLVKSELDKVKSIEGLRRVRSNTIQSNVRRNPGDPAWLQIDRTLGAKLKDLRSEAMREFSLKDPSLGKSAVDDLNQADKIYAEVAESIKNAIAKPESNLRPGVEAALKRWEKNIPDIIKVEKAISIKDPKKIAKIADDFPEAFEIVRDGYKTKFMKEANKYVSKEGLNVAKVSKALSSMDDKTLQIIYGPDARKIVDAMQVYLKSLPEKINPSGTGRFLDLIKTVSLQGYGYAQLKGLGQQAWLNKLIKNPNSPELLDRFGSLLMTVSKYGRPALYVPAKARQNESKGRILPPNVPPLLGGTNNAQ